jgi:hypothetical protein
MLVSSTVRASALNLDSFARVLAHTAYRPPLAAPATIGAMVSMKHAASRFAMRSASAFSF